MALLYGFIFSVCLMLVAWGIFYYCQNPGIIDVFWGLNITGIGLLYILLNSISGTNIIAAILLVMWGGRLSAFLFWTRIKNGEKDRRYDALSAEWHNKVIGFLWQYLFQGILAWILALPFFFLTDEQSFSTFEMICVTLIITGLIGETIADLQLLQHKKYLQGSVCQSGLWRYSRHPNYFFECLIWLGFSLMSVELGLGLLSMLSITTLFSVMWFFTIPMTEAAAIKKRGQAYIDYQQRTSIFFLRGYF